MRRRGLEPFVSLQEVELDGLTGWLSIPDLGATETVTANPAEVETRQLGRRRVDFDPVEVGIWRRRRAVESTNDVAFTGIEAFDPFSSGQQNPGRPR